MGGVVSGLVSGAKNIFGAVTGQNIRQAGQQSADISNQAAQGVAAAQTQALDYLKQQEALPTQIRGGALSTLAGLYGLPGGTGDQASFIQAAKASPLYQNLLQQGQEAVMRGASATGGLRSGNVQTALATNAQDVLGNVYNQRLAGISGLLGQTPDIASMISSAMIAPAQTIAQGQVAGAQAQQQAQQGYQQNLFGLAGAGLAALSDIRMKKNIKFKGEVNGHAWFEWEWNQKARKYGYTGKAEGVMAHFVYETNPDAISTMDGVLIVDYAKLGFERVH